MTANRVVLGLLGGLGLGLSGPARAWDLEGHQAIAALAEAQLSPSAKRALHALTGGVPLKDRSICFWADDAKQTRPETRSWHWVNIPKEAERLDHARDCPDRACVTDQIEAQLLRLSAKAGPVSERREALAFVVHLVADVHQPLHVGDAKDRGGNRIHVRLSATSTETDDLHWIWDGPVVTAALRSDPALRAPKGLELGPDAPEAWANESHRLVRTIYAEVVGPEPVLLPPDYLEKHAPIARQQLGRAAARLARVLEAALKGR